MLCKTYITYPFKGSIVEAIVIGIAISFNMLIIYWKLEKKRIIDAGLDVFALFILSISFSQSTSGMVFATIASAIISLFLLMKNPQMSVNIDKLDKKTYPFLDINEWKKRL